MIQINTKGILFICGGAFDGIEKIIAQRVNKQTIGFSSSEKTYVENDALLNYVNATDVKSFGLIPELVGRFPVVSYLNPLDPLALKRILTEPKNALIKQYSKIFELDGIKLDLTKDALDFVVEKALEYKLGARGLRSICESIMMDAMFELPSNGKEEQMFEVTLDYAKSKLSGDNLKNLKVA